MSAVTTAAEPVLIAGQWRSPTGSSTFQSMNPATRERLPWQFPISTWSECDQALDAAVKAARQLRRVGPEKIASFLEAFAARIEGAREALVEAAVLETALPAKPRLNDVELPRTTGQLRQAAQAARSGDWSLPVIDKAANIRACFEPIGPVCVFGPNNFPFAFGSVSGGDFAAAIAAGNPVIGKANSSHPRTTQLFAQLAYAALQETGLPLETVQLLYRIDHDTGAKLVADHRTGATGYTGSRRAGLVLKNAADRAGKPIYLELSSVNPVVILPGALGERSQAIVDEYVTSGLMGAGQFCTNPGLVMLLAGEATEQFIQKITERYAGGQPGTLLGAGVADSLSAAIKTLTQGGAKLLCGGGEPNADRCAVANTLLRTSGKAFIKDPELFQTEAFGNAALFVVCDSEQELRDAITHLEGNLTGCIYSSTKGDDDHLYDGVAFELTPKVGRILNDKMPTGVAVSPAMNHGGPFPATGHPGFTAVGIPASMVRFGKLTSYDNVRQPRLPAILRDANPTGSTWRRIDGRWTTE